LRWLQLGSSRTQSQRVRNGLEIYCITGRQLAAKRADLKN
jgi:hypothetical protein